MIDTTTRILMAYVLFGLIWAQACVFNTPYDKERHEYYWAMVFVAAITWPIGLIYSLFYNIKKRG